MKKMMKMAATVVALCFVSFPMMAQRVGSVSPAEDAFRGAFYDRAVVLSQRQMVDADILREKALQCSKLTIEMNAFLSIGQQDAARDKAREILALNPDDESAWNVLGIITPAADGPVYDDLRVEVDDNFQDQVCWLYDYRESVVVEEEVEEEAIPFELIEQKPSFQGGDANEFSKWVNSKLVYPEIAKENGVQGRVTLQFTVEADGRVTNVLVLRGVDESLDKEAVRVVQMSPRWTPGRQRDRAVKVTYTFPVIFELK